MKVATDLAKTSALLQPRSSSLSTPILAIDSQRSITPPVMDAKNKTPQQMLSAFWDDFITKTPGKVTSIFPHSLYANLLPPKHPKHAVVTHNAAESYEAAAEECKNKVQRIANECRRVNEKFTDPD